MIRIKILRRILWFIRLFPIVFKGPKLGINIKLENAGMVYIRIGKAKKSVAILYLACRFSDFSKGNQFLP